MDKFKKYCPNVWVAESEYEYDKGDVIELETKYGKIVECEVYNKVLEKNNLFYYSIVRLEDKTYAERKVEKYKNASMNNAKKSSEKISQAQEGAEFLSLGEPIKIGHHSEHRHRALTERNNSRMKKSMEYLEKAEEQSQKAKYWEEKANQITLAMPCSLEYFKEKLEDAIIYHKKLKSGEMPQAHAYSMSYASKEVRELKKKVKIAEALWG